jgi:hypothetical protein
MFVLLSILDQMEVPWQPLAVETTLFSYSEPSVRSSTARERPPQTEREEREKGRGPLVGLQ